MEPKIGNSSKNEDTLSFNKVTLSFAEHYNEIFEARDLFEDNLLEVLKNIHNQNTLELKKWQWGWDCDKCDSKEYDSYDKSLIDKPFFISRKSRIYLFNYDDKREKFYALFGFSFDIEDKGRGIVFFTSIAASNGSDEVFLKKFLSEKPKNMFLYDKVLYDDEYILYGCNIPLKDVTLEGAVKEVKRLIKVWEDFKKR